MSGYEEYRSAARSAVENAGGRPLLVEDSPSLSTSPRNACLDLVARSNLLVCIVGPRGGFRAPSGKLVVQEEFEEACRRSIPTLVFVHDIARDSDADELLSTVSDWVSGRYRRTFTSPAELQSLLESALAPLLTTMKRPVQDPKVVQDALTTAEEHHEAVLRLALAPNVKDELIDPLKLDSADFEKVVQGAAHDTGVFTYNHGKETRRRAGQLTIAQRPEHGTTGFAEVVITTAGLLAISVQVIADSASWSSSTFLSDTFEIQLADVQRALEAGFAFGHQLLEFVDPHRRYETWLYNAAILNPGMRRIVDAPARQNQAYSAGLNETTLVTAHDDPRPLTRATMCVPENEAARTARLLEKRLADASRWY